MRLSSPVLRSLPPQPLLPLPHPRPLSPLIRPLEPFSPFFSFSGILGCCVAAGCRTEWSRSCHVVRSRAVVDLFRGPSGSIINNRFSCFFKWNRKMTFERVECESKKETFEFFCVDNTVKLCKFFNFPLSNKCYFLTENFMIYLERYIRKY